MTTTVTAASPPRSTRFRVALASPLGVLVTVPSLVALLGIVMTILGRAALRAESQSTAHDLLVDQADYVAQDAEGALAQAAPILSRLHDVAATDDPSRPLATVAPALHDVVLAHAGVTYVSISYPDGTFRGAYLEGGSVHVQESRVGAGAMVRRYAFDDGVLSPRGEEPSVYDPRTRPFYRLAISKGTRAWTEPYTFYLSHLTGVTCTEPVKNAAGEVHAIVTVDFDIVGLSAMLGRSSYKGGRTILFSQNGTILAYAANGAVVPKAKGEEPLRAKDVADPAVEELVARSSAAKPDAVTFMTLGQGDTAELAAVATLKPPPGADASFTWHVAALAPESAVLGPLHVLETRSLIANLVAVALAIVVAIVLSRYIVRIRRELATTQASLTTAENRARELGSYRLVARLGAGGQGEVWRAEHRLLARAAAVKLIRADLPLEEIVELRERFRREAQALASMKSRHTIELFDYGVSEDGVFYYVMELLDGVDLETLVTDHGPQTSARTISILLQACSSLAEAHERGLLHRDVKPANLYLCRVADEVDVIKVLDFGLVNPIASRRSVKIEAASASDVKSLPEAASPKLTASGTVLGTPGFMSPEQATGSEEIDARADVYALGCVAWWLLTGKLVFDLPGVNELLVAHVITPPPELKPLVKGWLSPELAEIIFRCLAKAPSSRPDSARALAAELRAIKIPPEYAFGDEEARAWWSSRTIGEQAETIMSQPVVLVPKA